MPTAETPVVPARNDLKKVEVYAHSKAFELAGRNPGFEYQFMSTEADHPQYYGKYLAQHEIGDAISGYATVEPWEIVQARDVKQGRTRDDEGKSVDTAVKNGKLVLMRIPKAQYAAYEEIEKRRDAGQAKRLKSDKATLTAAGGGTATHSLQTSTDPNVRPEDLLSQAGA